MKRLLVILLLWVGVAHGQQILTQSTASTVNITLLDTTTGVGKTGITVTGITCDLAKETDTLASTKTTFTAAASGSANDAVEIAHGLYNVELSATNTNTLGRLDMVCQASNAYQAERHFLVVAAAANSWFDGSVPTAASIATAVGALTLTEPAQATPPTTGVATLLDGLSYPYFGLTNKLTVSSTTKSFYNRAADTLQWKKTIGSSGGTFTESVGATGP